VLSDCRTRWTVSSDTGSTVASGGGLDVVDVAELSSAANCVEECDHHESCRGVDVNETARPLVSCRFYLGTTDVETLGSISAPGVVQFIAERCPEDGIRHHMLLHRKFYYIMTIPQQFFYRFFLFPLSLYTVLLQCTQSIN